MSRTDTLKMAAKGTPIRSLIGQRVAVETQSHGRLTGTVESIAYNLYPVVRLDMGGTFRAGSVIEVL